MYDEEFRGHHKIFLQSIYVFFLLKKNIKCFRLESKVQIVCDVLKQVVQVSDLIVFAGLNNSPSLGYKFSIM